MSFGQTLRAAREAKGLTLSQVAHDTRILVQIVTDMENEDFHRIPAAIYGRGFVRLFAEEVGLDPAPLTQEFMDIFSGKRPPMSRMPAAPVAPVEPEPRAEPLGTADVSPLSSPIEVPPPVNPFAPPEAVPAPAVEPASGSGLKPAAPIKETTISEPEPVAAPKPVAAPEPAPEPEPPVQPAVVKGLALFDPPAPQAPRPEAPSALPPQIDATSPYLTTSPYEGDGPSVGERFRAGLSNISANLIHRVREVPRSVWRIALLTASVLLVVILIILGCTKLYKLTTPSAPEAPASRADGTSEIELPPATDAQPHAVRPSVNPSSATPKSATPAVPGKLRSTGENVPSLYLD